MKKKMKLKGANILKNIN